MKTPLSKLLFVLITLGSLFAPAQSRCILAVQSGHPALDRQLFEKFQIKFTKSFEVWNGKSTKPDTTVELFVRSANEKDPEPFSSGENSPWYTGGLFRQATPAQFVDPYVISRQPQIIIALRLNNPQCFKPFLYSIAVKQLVFSHKPEPILVDQTTTKWINAVAKLFDSKFSEDKLDEILNNHVQPHAK